MFSTSTIQCLNSTRVKAKESKREDDHMTVEKKKNDDVLLVMITGSVDANTSAGLRDEIVDELDDVACLTFDMTDMDYISSAGLRVILEAYQILEEKDGKVILENVREELMYIFELTGFSDYMEFRN